VSSILKNYSYDPAKCSLSLALFEAFLVLSKDIESTESFTELDFYKGLEAPKDKSKGDYALPSFRFAKAIKKNPAEFASSIKLQLETSKNNWIEKIECAGPFLNIFVSQKEVAKILIPEILNNKWFEKLSHISGNDQTKVMIEYSQPNTHKEFHVGHGRNVCLGDSLCRLYKYSGYKVIGANYIGDEGTHIAKCLWGIKNYSGEKLTEATKNRAEWLGHRYVEANNKLKEAENDSVLKEKYKNEISEIHHAIESKKGEQYDLWVKTRQYCLDDFNTIYKWLDVHFDHFFYESEVSEASQEIVEEYTKKGLFYEDKGAIGFDMQDKKLGFFIARKSDGTTLYATKDLALAKVKFNDFDISRSIYVVASEQNFHFKQVFYALEKMGFKQAQNCYHLSYGMVVRPEGKMSSRAGNSFTFLQLIDLVIEEINTYLEKYKDEWDKEKISDTAHKLAVGAIKYGMLEADPNKEIVFDPKEWVSFEGNSGPYLMYSYARTQSIINRAASENISPANEHLDLLTHESERDLMRYLYDFNHTAIYACENYKPSTLANHLYFMCKAYNRFYVEVSVLKAENNELRGARLALLVAFSKTLKQGLYLLGITPPEKM
jgi:arginyl-tRNA synthetase